MVFYFSISAKRNLSGVWTYFNVDDRMIQSRSASLGSVPQNLDLFAVLFQAPTKRPTQQMDH